MKSASLELFRYLEREGLQPAGDPYIQLQESSDDRGPAQYESQTTFIPLFVPICMVRIHNRRWLVQWFQFSFTDPKPPEARASEVVELLEQVVLENAVGSG